MSKNREVILPLTAAGIQCLILVQFKKDVDKLERVQKRALIIIKGLENMPFSDKELKG